MLFGTGGPADDTNNDKKAVQSKKEAGGVSTAVDLLEMIGEGGLDQEPGALADDCAILIEEDAAIVVEDEKKEVKNNLPNKTNKDH